MTAPLVEVVDLSRYEFEIQCEWNCSEPAAYMCRGCADSAHRALCHYHMAAVKRRFDENCGRVICENCHRPWLDFTTHYDVADL